MEGEVGNNNMSKQDFNNFNSRLYETRSDSWGVKGG